MTNPQGIFKRLRRAVFNTVTHVTALVGRRGHSRAIC